MRCAICNSTLDGDDILPWVPLCGPDWIAEGKPLFWPDDIAAANEAVCDSLAQAAAELDGMIVGRTRCTCGGRGICVHCVLDAMGRDTARAA